MGQVIAQLDKAELRIFKKHLLKQDIVRLRQIHQGFKMLCDSFAISFKEFQ